MSKTRTQPDLLKPRWSKVYSDLWANKLRTALVVASIAAGVFAIGMIATAYAILSEDIHLSYAAVNPPNIEIWTDPFQEDLLGSIERLSGVAQAEGRSIQLVRTSLDGLEWQNQILIAIDDFEAMHIRLLAPLEGNPSPGRGEMIVSQSFMNKTGYPVGAPIQVELPDGSTHRLRLAGLVTDQAGGGNPTMGATAFITIDTLQSMGESGDFNRLYVTVDGQGDDPHLIAAVAADVEDQLERNRMAVYRTDTQVSTVHPQSTMALAIFGVLGALGALITLLSSSLIINTLNALLAQQLRQIGVMKLVGGRSRQILGMYLLLIFSYSWIALMIAMPGGVIAGAALARFIADMMDVVLQGFRIIPAALLLQVLVAFLIPLGAGFFPVKRGAKINVRRAISNDRPGNQPDGLRWLHRLSRWFPWISRPLLLSIRNTFRQKGRLLLTIFTLTVAGAIFIGVFNVRASMTRFMDQLAQHFKGDITLNFSQPYRIQRIENTLLPLPGIRDLEGWGSATAEIWDEQHQVVENMQIVAPPCDTTLLEVDIVAGRWLQPGEPQALVVSDSIYNAYPDLQPGDQLLVKMPGKREARWTVVGVFRYIDMLGDTLAYADFDFITGLQGLPHQAASYRLITDQHSEADQQQIVQYLDQYLSQRGFQISNMEAGLVLQEKSAQMVTILVSFLLVMALLIAFVGSIGLTGTMGMNVLERTREIGVMRAIGAVDFEIIKSVVIEALMIGLMTWVLAIGLSFPISYFLLRIISASMMGSPLPVTFTPLGIYLWLMVVILLSLVSSLLPARNAARLTINEVLAYE